MLGHPVVVQSAVRDEGTSYHYAASARVIDADPAGVAALVETLDAIGADYVTGRTWTTDAFYREPRTRIARRVEEECLVVEMEAAAFIAVARFRGVRLGSCSMPATAWPARSGTTVTGIKPLTSGPACSTWPRPQRYAWTPPELRRATADGVGARDGPLGTRRRAPSIIAVREDVRSQHA